MIDTLIVSVIVVTAAFFVGRRLYRQFTNKTSACGCSGCGKSGSCSGISDSPDTSACGNGN